MATTNVTFGTSWAKIVDDGDEFLLTMSAYQDTVEVAVGEPGVGVGGHQLDVTRGESINRTLLGPGDIYGRKITGEDVIGVLTVWTPA